MSDTDDGCSELIIAVADMNRMCSAFVDLMNELQDEGLDIRAVTAAMWMCIGVGLAQSGGRLPQRMLVKDVQPLRDGYEMGLAMRKPRADA